MAWRQPTTEQSTSGFEALFRHTKTFEKNIDKLSERQRGKQNMLILYLKGLMLSLALSNHRSRMNEPD